MKLEKFKEKNNKKEDLTISGRIFVLFFILFASFAIFLIICFRDNIYDTRKETGMLAFYINEVVSKTIPSKEEGYVLDLEKSNCTHDATVEWNNEAWAPIIKNMKNSKTKCTLYFKEASIFDLCVDKYGAASPQCTIIAAATEDKSLCPTVNADGTVNISDTEKTNALLCTAPDDYGTSYYFRGVPENNWVKFGGYYWRIIRINGDDSVRLIYAGDASVIDALDETTKTTVLANGYDDSSTQYTQIGTNPYNEYWKKDNVLELTKSYVYYDNAGVGYMYGNRDGIAEQPTQSSISSWTSTDTYYVSLEYNYDTTTDRFTLKDPIPVLASEMTTDYVGYYTFNQTSSITSSSYVYKITSVSVGESSTTVGYKYVRSGTTSLEKAQTNINDSDIKSYLDSWYETNLASYSEYISDTLFCNDRSLSATIPSEYSNLGYGVEKTAYRWNSSSNGIRLTCSQVNDRFTVDDEVIGNGDLTYPIGLITTDEAWIAGGANSNSSYYLYTGYNYWTMTPVCYDGHRAYVRRIYNDGGARGSNNVVSSVGVRPVINLRPNVLKFGDGTASNPYTIV